MSARPDSVSVFWGTGPGQAEAGEGGGGGEGGKGGGGGGVSRGFFLDVLFISGSCLSGPDLFPRGWERGVEKLVSTIYQKLVLLLLMVVVVVVVVMVGLYASSWRNTVSTTNRFSEWLFSD